MNEAREETGFEIGVVVPKRRLNEEGDKGCDCVELLVSEFRKAGLIVERVNGLSNEFIKLAATVETLGRAATELRLKKLTHVGIDILFEWDQVDAFVREPDGSLFSWCERFHCFHHLIYGIVGYSLVQRTDSTVTLSFDGKLFQWGVGEPLLKRMESEGIVKEVFPLHDETRRKELLRNWALNVRDFTWQPIDEIYSYFGTKVEESWREKLPHTIRNWYKVVGGGDVKHDFEERWYSYNWHSWIATYFAFLGMYTRWLLFPAAFGITLRLIDFGPWQLLVLPVFFTFTISWAVLFLQFWKRKNSALLTRWQISQMAESETGYRVVDERSVPIQSCMELQKKVESDKPKEGRNAFQKEEWFGQLLRFRNDAIVVLGIIFLQLPLELAYAHLYEVLESDITRFGLTALYLLVIQYYTRIGGKISVKLVKDENNKSSESSANSLVYKVFGLYFMQSYIGLFYHAILYRNFMTLRQVLIQRLIVSQVLENLLENSIPYLKYSYKKFRTVHKKKREDGSSAGKKIQLAYRVEKEYLKPTYSASNGQELEDGLFDDFLELALQFGMIMMFACAFPLAFAFAALNNITEIRADAMKLLVMLRRPVPRADATIGAWLNIFQFLIVMSICTNCVLLVCLYDQEGKWKIEPGLAAILIIEHVLLLLKFVFSRFVPEEPAWVKAARVKNAAQAQVMCSNQLRNIYSLERKTH